MKLVFDIGANRGLFTDKCLSLFENVDLIMVEANPTLHNYLINKYRTKENIKVLNNLVSEKDNEDIDFFISNADTISTASLDWIQKSRFTNDYNWNNKVKVKSISIDNMISNFGVPDLIKIDVEGYELEVLKGLTKKVSKICFEWAEEEYDKINKTCEHLQSIGYEQFGFIEKDDYLVEPEIYSKWSECSIHNIIIPERKEKWGMIWVK
jgi:FkbM family methyltransferase